MNYVLIFPDELRAESLGCYGHPYVQTPNIDRLAAEGTLFEQNYTQHPVCVSSRCALATGLYPHVRGFRSLRNLLPDTEANFFRQIRDAGYTTGIIGKDDCFDAESNQRVFSETYRFGRGGGGAWGKGGPVDIDRNYALLSEAAEAPTGDDFCNQDAADFLAKRKTDGKPFFLWLNYSYPHPAYTCPEPYYSMYDDCTPEMRDESWVNGKPELYHAIRRNRHGDDPKNAGLYRKVNAVYLGMVSYVDKLVGEVMQMLRENGQLDDTTVILCSDHGDFAGDCGLAEKWPSALDDMLARVPLIIRRPGEKQGHRVTTPTQSMDIFPTVFDFENIEIRHDQFGVSLRPQVEGAAGDVKRVVYTEGGYDVREPQCFEGTEHWAFMMVPGGVYYPKLSQQQNEPATVCRAVMRRDARYKFIFRTSGDNELYDMLEDPKEYRNLIHDPAYSGLRTELEHKLLAWFVGCSDTSPHEEFLPEDVWHKAPAKA